MDTKFLERIGQLLALILLIFFVFLPGRVDAAPAQQNGACPPNSYLITTPAGTWPSDMGVCSYNLYLVNTTGIYSDYYPCSQRVQVSTQGVLPDTRHIIYVPDENQYYGSQIRFKALVYAVQITSVIGPPLPPPGATLDNTFFGVQYYNHLGNLGGATYKTANSYPYIDTYFSSFPWTYYYRVYIVDETLSTYTGQAGYIRLRLTNEGDDFIIGVSSVRIGNYYDNMPDHCPIPNANLPGTPTPVGPTATLPPTWTPNPTVGTSTPTPITTPPATSSGGTPAPNWTPTPLVFPTIPAENTPTPWAPVSIPTIVWPTLPPTVVAGVIPTIDTTLGGIDDLVDTINDDWQSSVDFGTGALDLDNADTTGTSSPNAIINEIAALVSVPVSYVKAIQTYLPNTAPYVAFLILMASWVPFNMMAKFGLTILSRLFELVRRIVELIPGF